MRPLIYSVLFFFIVNFSAHATKTLVEVDKVIEKSFPITADGTFDVTNRYGNIDITTWDQNKIDIRVTITVKTGSQKKADEIFDRIDVKFSDQKDYVSAKTEIESKSNSWFGWGSWTSTDYEINYDVKMPASVHLKCENKFGNTYLVDLNNGAELVMKYGSIRMGSMEGPTSLDLGYGSLDFGDIGDLEADVKYSKLKGSSTQDIKIDSKYSDINIGDVKVLKSDSKYDEYFIDRVIEIRNSGKYDDWAIGEVGSLFLESGYTDIKIEKLKGDLDLDQKFGSLEIDRIDCVDATVRLDLSYTDVKLDTEDCGDIRIDYKGEYTDLNLPGDLEDKLEREGKRTWLNTEFGNGNLQMKLNMRYGSLKIR